MSPGNMGPHAEVPESTPHTGPLSHTDHAPHPAVPADHTQDLSTGAKTSDDETEPQGHCAHEHQNQPRPIGDFWLAGSRSADTTTHAEKLAPSGKTWRDGQPPRP